MPRPRFHKLEPEKQQRILDEAGREFARHGYRGASLNGIIEAAGISKGAFYYYFDDKADLFTTVLRHARDTVFEHDSFDFSELSRDQYWSVVNEISRRGIAYSRAHPWMIELSRTLYGNPDDFGEPLQAFLRESQRLIRDFLVRGRSLGAVRNDVPLSLQVTVVNAVDRAVDLWFAENWQDDPESDEIDRLGDKVVEMLRGLLSPPHEGITST